MAVKRTHRRRSGAALSLIALSCLVAGCRGPRADAEPRPEQTTARSSAARPERQLPTAHPGGAPARSAPSEDAATRIQLAETTVHRLQFTADTGDYLDVVKVLRTVTGIPILVSPEARTVIADEALVLEIEIVAPLSVANLLDLMVSKSPALGWTVRNGVTMLTSKAHAGGEVVLRTHDVRALTLAGTEFLPPVIRDLPSGEPEAEGSRSGGEGDEKVSAIEPDNLLQVVKMSTEPDYWDTEGGGTIEYVDSGYLLVMATPAMQRAVARALSTMQP